MGRQDLFIGFEGVMITVAVLVLNVFHPSLCFGEIMDRKFEAGDDGTRKEIRQSEFEMLPETKPSTATSVTDARGSSLNTNDVERGA